MCCWGPEGCQWGAFGSNALSYSFKRRFPRKQNDCVQTLVVFPNSTGTPESHLVASYALCELKNPLGPKRAALYGVDLTNSAESRPDDACESTSAGGNRISSAANRS